MNLSKFVVSGVGAGIGAGPNCCASCAAGAACQCCGGAGQGVPAASGTANTTGTSTATATGQGPQAPGTANPNRGGLIIYRPIISPSTLGRPGLGAMPPMDWKKGAYGGAAGAVLGGGAVYAMTKRTNAALVAALVVGGIGAATVAFLAGSQAQASPPPNGGGSGGGTNVQPPPPKPTLPAPEVIGNIGVIQDNGDGTWAYEVHCKDGEVVYGAAALTGDRALALNQLAMQTLICANMSGPLPVSSWSKVRFVTRLQVGSLQQGGGGLTVNLLPPPPPSNSLTNL